MQDLSITLVQTHLFWGDKDRNLEHFDALLKDVSGSDLIILPEMFNTGFMTQPAPVAETMDGPTLSWMREKAAALGITITGSLIIREEDQYFNRLIWMPPDGAFRIYNKRHLFRMAGEHERMSMGTERLIVGLKGWNICPLVCYDLRFPAWSRNTYRDGVYGYDLLIYVANWPEVRAIAWKRLLPARAIENQCYVAGLNRVGADGQGIFHSGDSAVIDPKGNSISQVKANESFVQNIILKRKELDDFRAKFQVGRDWDDFGFST